MSRPISTKQFKRARCNSPKPSSVKAKSSLGSVSPDSVELLKTAGTRSKGGGSGGEAWIVLADGKRAGTAYINLIDDPVRGRHPSFHIFLNRHSQGREIGRIVYKRCCLLSQYDAIYAHMRKSNTASRKAAEHAGFTNATSSEDTQLVMVWYRQAES